MPRIGIPRALLYYQYYPLWSAFFQGMGLEVVLSEPTSKAIMAAGSLRVVAETCLPVKVYCGHVTDLIGKCDYIFIPAIRSIQKNVYNCSKFLGLPDLIKAVIPRCPTIIDVDIDASKGKVGLHPSTYDIGRWIQPKPKGQKEAAQHAWQVHLDYQETLKTRGITPIEYLVHDQGNYDSHHCERSGAISTPLRDCSGLQPRNDIARNPCGGIPGDRDYAPPTQTPTHLTIAVIGHPYNIYDDFITHRILYRLNSLGARVVTPEIAG
ncbi:MAG: acyl-CoA dehydratase activase-related protein, partial [Dehalococcoidia bacterium]|nr:acyl-CoA dehydratase activase-related protein [Dehalococcoidia bacterium]